MIDGMLPTEAEQSFTSCFCISRHFRAEGVAVRVHEDWVRKAQIKDEGDAVGSSSDLLN